MRSRNVIALLAILALAGCTSGGGDTAAESADGGGGGSSAPPPPAAPDLAWTIREVEFGGSATPAASVSVGGYSAWSDGGNRWKTVIPSHLLQLEQGQDLELEAKTAAGGRRNERIGIQVER